MKLIGKILITLSLLILGTILFLGIFTDYQANFYSWFFGALSFIWVFLGIAFLYINALAEKRKKFIRVAFIIFAFLILSTFLFGYMHFPGTGILFIVTCCFLSFTILPVYTKTKIEKWVLYTKKRWHAYLLSLGDLISIASLVLGYLFKKQHWPGANIMLALGLILLAVCLLLWNRLFSQEIVLRKKAETEAESRLVEIEKQKNLIEEKNLEIISSMRYASRIQQSLLPNEKYLEKNIKNKLN